MDNFKFVITILLFICFLGLMDTHSVRKALFNEKAFKSPTYKATYADFDMIRTRNLLSINKLIRSSQDESQDELSNNILLSIGKKNN